jgi:hypothetical protein
MVGLLAKQIVRHQKGYGKIHEINEARCCVSPSPHSFLSTVTHTGKYSVASVGHERGINAPIAANGLSTREKLLLTTPLCSRIPILLAGSLRTETIGHFLVQGEAYGRLLGFAWLNIA